MRIRKAFTLIELLVVISIIAVLLAILMPCLRIVKEHARRAVCQNNLHQAAAAMFMYAGDFDDSLPLGSIIDRTAPGYSASWDRADQMALVNAETMLPSSFLQNILVSVLTRSFLDLAICNLSAASPISSLRTCWIFV